MLLATKIKATLSGTVRVEVAGLMLRGEEQRCAIRDVVCVCAPDGEIEYVEFGGAAAGPDFFGEDQAEHLRALCESSCKRVGGRE